MVINPMCDMDLDVYKDWIYEFNNNDDLRSVDFASIVFGLCDDPWFQLYDYYGDGECSSELTEIDIDYGDGNTFEYGLGHPFAGYGVGYGYQLA